MCENHLNRYNVETLMKPLPFSYIIKLKQCGEVVEIYLFVFGM